MATEESVHGDEETTDQVPAVDTSTDDIRINVGGLWFVLDQATYLKMNSPLLNSLIHADSHDESCGKTNSNEYLIQEADHECFSTFLHITRYDTLPLSVMTSKDKRTKLLQQADFWGIRSAVDNALARAEKEIADLLSEPDKAEEVKPGAVETSPEQKVRSRHHNRRRADGGDISFGTFCTMCDYREEKLVFLSGEYYSSCKSCQKEILYQAELNFCHKCMCCVDCQRDDVSCPNTAIFSSQETLSMFSKLEDKISALRDKV